MVSFSSCGTKKTEQSESSSEAVSEDNGFGDDFFDFGGDGATEAEQNSGGASAAQQSGGGGGAGGASAGTKTSTGSGVAGNKSITVTLATFWKNEYEAPAGTDPYCDLFTKAFNELKKSGVKVVIKSYDPNTAIDSVTKSVMAGDQPFDIFETSLHVARNLALNGMLYDQSTIKSINLNSENFSDNKATIEAFTYKNKVYGSSFLYPHGSFIGVFYNKTLLSKYNQTDPYQMYKDGTWTFDNYAKMADNMTIDTDNDGKPNIWGTYGTFMVGEALTANAGGTVIRSNGKYEVAMTSEAGIEGMNWVRKMIHEDKSLCTNGMNGASDAFAAGQSAFFPVLMYYSMVFGNNMKDEFGVVPIPKGYRQSTYVTGTYDARPFVFPKNLADPEAVGKVYSEMSKLCPMVRDVVFERYADTGINKDGMQVYKDMAKYLRPEFIGGVDVSSFNADLENSVLQVSGNPATTMNNYKSKFQSAVDDYYAKAK